MSGGRAAAALVLLCLAGCGQKGPLYLPDPAPQAVPAAPAAPAADEGQDKDQKDGAQTPATAPPAPAR